MAQESALVFLVLHGIMITVEAREFCEAEPGPSDDYYCDVGHCCGEGECCTYYYELWWFWLVWFMIVFVIGFCVWQRKKFHPWREHQAFRNQCGLCGPPDLYPDILPIPPVKLPSYAEIGETASFNTPPPPYTCECYMPTVSSSMCSFDQPPPEIGAPPCYMQYEPVVAPLLPRMNSSTSSMGTQFPEGGMSPTDDSPMEQLPTVPAVVHPTPPPSPPEPSSPVQSPVRQPPSSPDSPCLSCSSPSTPLTTSRSCSCSSTTTQSPAHTVNTRGGPGLAFPVGLGTNLYFKPAWYSGGSMGKSVNNAKQRLQVPLSQGANHNPCPRCVSRSASFLGQVSDSAAVMRDASTSTLTSVVTSGAPSLQNQEPERYERRNSYSLPRNFVCSTKRPTT